MAKVQTKKDVSQIKSKSVQMCDICHLSTEVSRADELVFGDWLEHAGIRVHYFCLLFGAQLPQRGQDNNGFLGFLVSDIRKAIKWIETKTCTFCTKSHANIQCYKCKEYFHFVCGTTEKCLFVFDKYFRSYCKYCLPLNKKEQGLLKQPPADDQRCVICEDVMGPYNPVEWIYGPCCNRGFAHRVCMLQYALNAGYYLCCIWCANTNFRILIRQKGIYVPDRDALWEIDGRNYLDLYRGHQRCDMELCLCAKGRDYKNGKWTVIKCKLCGSYGAHNPICITGDLKGRILCTMLTTNDW